VPEQIVGLTTSLIPFLANDYIARALVGTQQASQAVPPHSFRTAHRGDGHGKGNG